MIHFKQQMYTIRPVAVECKITETYPDIVMAKG